MLNTVGRGKVINECTKTRLAFDTEQSKSRGRNLAGDKFAVKLSYSFVFV